MNSHHRLSLRGAAVSPPTLRWPRIGFGLFLVAVGLRCAAGFAQENVKRAETPERLVFDFSAGQVMSIVGPKTNRAPVEIRPVFTDQGAGYEASFDFVMRRKRVAVNIVMPGPGKPDLTLTNPAALVEMREIRTAPPQCEYEIVAKTPVRRTELSAQAVQRAREALVAQEQQAREEAKSKDKAALKSYLARQGKNNPPDDEMQLRELFAQARAVELGAEPLRAKLREFAEGRPGWFLETDRAGWRSASGRKLMDLYVAMLELELGEAYLKRFGFEFDGAKRNAPTLIHSKLDAVTALLGGANSGSSSPTARTSRSLSTDDLELLYKAMTVAAVGRFYFTVEPADANSQWFNGQRVTCQARGTAAVRIEGRLDPKNHDVADWWILDGYDDGRIAASFPKNPNIGHQIFTRDGQTRLRLYATGAEAAPYVVEFRPKTTAVGSRELVIHEFSPVVETKFPF